MESLNKNDFGQEIVEIGLKRCAKREEENKKWYGNY